VAGRCDVITSRRAVAIPGFVAVPLRQRKVHSRQHARWQSHVVVAQAAATAEGALKTDLHKDLKKALANVKPKVG